MIREEKPKVKKKVKFTDNVNIMFPEIREIVNNEPTKDEEYKIGLSIPNVSTVFLNQIKELKFLKTQEVKFVVMNYWMRH